MPTPIPLNENHPDYSPDKGKPGDLCPPCTKQQLAHLGHWQGHGQLTFPEELLSPALVQMSHVALASGAQPLRCRADNHQDQQLNPWNHV